MKIYLVTWTDGNGNVYTERREDMLRLRQLLTAIQLSDNLSLVSVSANLP